MRDLTREVPEAAVLIELERRAMATAGSAAEVIRSQRPQRVRVASTKSSATDVVTEMDVRIQTMIVQDLAQSRPDDAVLGEEQGGRDGHSGITWVLDPIDGTVNYLYGIPAYAVSVAAVIGDPTVPGGWQPVAGAVAHAALDEISHARLGGGSWMIAGSHDPLRLHASGPDSAALALVGTGFSYVAQERAEQGAVLAQLLPKVRDIRRGGSAALDLCAVAQGRLDAYYETGLNSWDLAAGWLIAAESGVIVAGSGPGAGPSKELTWACAPELAGAFAQLLGEAIAYR